MAKWHHISVFLDKIYTFAGLPAHIQMPSNSQISDSYPLFAGDNLSYSHRRLAELAAFRIDWHALCSE